MAALLLGAALIAVSQLIEPVWLRAAIEMPAVLLAPGGALVFLVFGPDHRLRGELLVPLVLLASLATYAALALLLNAVGLPISSGNVTAAVVTWIVVVGALSLARRGPGVTSDEATEEPSSGSGSAARVARDLALAIGLIAAVVGISQAALPKPAPRPYSALSFAGGWATLSGTVKVPASRRLTVPVRIVNREKTTQHYVIRPSVATVGRWVARAVDLAPNASRTVVVQGAAPATGCASRLLVRLSRAGQTTSDQQLTAWLEGSAAQCPGQQAVPPPS